MIEGLRAVRVLVPDLDQAGAWYSNALEVQPCSTQPDCVDFYLDGYHLILNRGQPSTDAATVAYWGVDNALAVIERLLELGATLHEPLASVDEFTARASVRDPFGNLFGIAEVRDPNEQRARSHRVAEKLALRNVRSTLDELAVAEKKQKQTLRVVFSLIAIVAIAAAIFLANLMSRPKGERVENFLPNNVKTR